MLLCLLALTAPTILRRHLKEAESFEAQIGAERERQAAAMRQRLASLRATKMRNAQAAER